MSRILQIIGILIFVSGCNSEKSELQELWIGKYSVHHSNSENESISDGQRKILRFKKDSLQIKNFYFDFITDTNDIHTIKYQVKSDRILLNEKNGIDTFNYKFSLDSLLLSYYNQYPRKSVYQKLPKYNLASKELELYKLLTSSSFEILDSIRIEFKNDGRLIIPNFNLSIGDNQFWMIDKYKGELFLVIDGFSGFIFHISEINLERVGGIIYGKVDKKIFFNKLPQKTNNKIDDLIGEWVELRIEEISAPPPFIENKRDFFDKEELLITDSTIIKSKFFRIDTIQWETNREEDLIVLPKLDLPIRQKKWRIISLTSKELIIERIPRVNLDGNQIEIIKYKRK